MKNKFNPGEKVWIEAEIEKVEITRGAIEYRVFVEDGTLIPFYLTIPEDTIRTGFKNPFSDLTPHEFRQRILDLRKNENLTEVEIATRLGMTLQSFKQWLAVANSAPLSTTIGYTDLNHEGLYKEMTLEEIREERSSND